MRRTFSLLSIFLLISCATPSKPVSNSDSLPSGYGVAFFSTVDDGSTNSYRSTTNRAIVGILSLGMTEVDDGDDVQLHFEKHVMDSEIESKHNSASSFYVFHSYLTKERAITKKWHILKLKEGSYELKKLTSRTGNMHKTVNYENGYAFTIKAGEAVFLGNVKLALKKIGERKFGSDTTIDIDSPFVTGIEWNAEEASQELSRYKNYPKLFRSAKL